MTAPRGYHPGTTIPRRRPAEDHYDGRGQCRHCGTPGLQWEMHGRRWTLVDMGGKPHACPRGGQMTNDTMDALAYAMGIKVVHSDLIGPGQAFLFRDPMPMRFEIPKPVFDLIRDVNRIAMYACYTMPSPRGIIMGCDFCGPEPKRRKWHWKYRGHRRWRGWMHARSPRNRQRHADGRYGGAGSNEGKTYQVNTGVPS